MSRTFLTPLFAFAGAIVTPSEPAVAARASVPVPVELRGKWAASYDTIVEPCRPRHPDDAKRSMTADRNGFRYWEARAMPTKVRRTSANVFVIDLDAAGEGEQWRKRMTLTLADNGRRLVTDDIYAGTGTVRLHYRRCGS